MRHRSWTLVSLAFLLAGTPGPTSGQDVPSRREAVPTSEPATPPVFADDPMDARTSDAMPGVSRPEQLPTAPTGADEKPLPINLATALHLSDARPLVIEAARAGLEVAAAEWQGAKVLWLPSLYAGGDYYRHDGGFQSPLTGDLVTNSRQSLLLGPGFGAIYAATDAIFAPLAARQVVRAREAEVQTSKNDAMRDVAVAYFDVQQARGRLAGALDAVAKARELLRRVEGLGGGLTAPIEDDRVRTLLAELEQTATSAREDWRVASAELTRILRLDPTATVLPMELPHSQITLIRPDQAVDPLVPIALTNRPELATVQSIVEATLVRLRQEKLRPLIPSIVFAGNSGSSGTGNGYGPLAGGFFAGAPNDSLNQTSPRFDLTASMFWELRNFGFGNRALIRERQGQNHQALVELFQVQDRIAAEVARTHAQLQSAATRVGQAETGVNEALVSFEGNLRGLGETTRFGDVLNLVIRPQEAVNALEQLDQAYRNYFTTVGDYNRAQFRLFHDLGYPASVLACERPPGTIQPVDTRRPPQMAPVRPAPPCTGPNCVPKPAVIKQGAPAKPERHGWFRR